MALRQEIPSVTETASQAGPPAALRVASIDPATGAVNKYFPATEITRTPELLSRARAAQAAWAEKPLHERGAQLELLRDAIFDARDEIADVITRETGKPRVEAILAEIALAIDTT